MRISLLLITVALAACTVESAVSISPGADGGPADAAARDAGLGGDDVARGDTSPTDVPTTTESAVPTPDAPCIDNDSDGYPTSECGGMAPDCDDNNPMRNPGRTEVCDSMDNNCNMTIDEGCPTSGCIPALEVCDGVDNNCNEVADEGCTLGCVPYNEVCNDNLDNDCDEMVDEGCGPICTPFVEICDGLDNDCDGVADDNCTECSGEQMAEICDGLDNDCDGLVDEGCPTEG